MKFDRAARMRTHSSFRDHDGISPLPPPGDNASGGGTDTFTHTILSETQSWHECAGACMFFISMDNLWIYWSLNCTSRRKASTST